MAQHIIHQSHGDWQAGRDSNNMLWLMFLGIIIILAGIGGIMNSSFGLGVILILVGVGLFLIGKKGWKKVGNYYKRKNNSQIIRTSYD